MAFSYGWRGPNIVKDGLVLYLDPGSPNSYFNKSSTIINDISGNKYNSTVNNGPIYNTTNGGSLKLDGVNDSITIPSHPTSSGLTLSFWLNIPSAGSTGLDTIIGDGSQSNTVGFIWIYRAYTNGVQWQVATNTTRANFNDTALLSGSFNTWVNISFVANYSNPTTASLSIYKNGVVSSTSSIPNGQIPLSRNRFIGSYSGGNFFDRFSFGQYLEYSKALTPQEILQNYNVTKTRFGL